MHDIDGGVQGNGGAHHTMKPSMDETWVRAVVGAVTEAVTRALEQKMALPRRQGEWSTGGEWPWSGSSQWSGAPWWSAQWSGAPWSPSWNPQWQWGQPQQWNPQWQWGQPQQWNPQWQWGQPQQGSPSWIGGWTGDAWVLATKPGWLAVPRHLLDQRTPSTPPPGAQAQGGQPQGAQAQGGQAQGGQASESWRPSWDNAATQSWRALCEPWPGGPKWLGPVRETHQRAMADAEKFWSENPRAQCLVERGSWAA